MTNTKNLSRSVILSIVETYEGMLRIKMTPELLALWTEWKARLVLA